jgi:hypothetical protein
MKAPFEDLGWILNLLSIVRVRPICQTGNTDAFGIFVKAHPMGYPSRLPVTKARRQENTCGIQMEFSRYSLALCGKAAAGT